MSVSHISRLSVDIYNQNIELFSAAFPALVSLVTENSSQINLKLADSKYASSGNDLSSMPLQVYVDNQSIIYNWCDQVDDIKTQLLSSANTVRVQRPVAERLDEKVTPEKLLSDIIGSEYPESLDVLTSLRSVDQAEPCLSKLEQCRDCIVLGSLNLVPLLVAVRKGDISPVSITLCETSELDLKVLLHLFSFQDMVADLKAKGIGFSLLFNSDSDLLKHELLSFLSQSQTPSLNGLFYVESTLSAPELLTLSSWFKDPDGYTSFVLGFMGNDTDEINQFAHSVWNSISSSSQFLINQIQDVSAVSVICASGPSLDRSLPWLKKHQDDVVIFASGSSLGALLANNIRPKFAVILEMSHIIYEDLRDFLDSGYSLEGISLIASPTIDPRIMPMFKEVHLFHRPLSTAMAFYPSEMSAALIQSGPQAANAALEAALKVGFKKLVLAGCDFSGPSRDLQRANQVIGQSDRVLDLPMQGRGAKTVYTSTDLSVTSQLFQAALDYYQPDCYSLPEGIYLDGVSVVNSLDDLEQLLPLHPENVISFDQQLKISFPKRRQPSLLQDLSSIKDYLPQYVSSLLSIINAHSGWSCSLSRQLSTYLNVGLTEEDPRFVVLKRLTRFPLFFIVQSLHDSVDDASWSNRKHRAISDVESYFNFIDNYLNVLLHHVSRQSSWDHSLFSV